MEKQKNDAQKMNFLDDPEEIFNKMYLNMLADETGESGAVMDLNFGADDGEELNEEGKLTDI